MGNITTSNLKTIVQSVLASARRYKPNLSVTDPDDPRYVAGAEGLVNKVSKAQTTAETAKSTAESAKSTAASAKSTAETAKSTAETAKSTAETAKSTAETAKSTAESKMDAINPTGTGMLSINTPYAFTPGKYTFGCGSNAYAAGAMSSACGRNVVAMGEASHAEGYGWRVSAYATGEKDSTEVALENIATSEDQLDLIERGVLLHEGTFYKIDKWNEQSKIATLRNALGETLQNTHVYLCAAASGDQSHVEGEATNASHLGAHAEGRRTYASGNASHAEGCSTVAGAFCTHAEGYGTVANYEGAHAEGEGTIANGGVQHVEGRYNAYGEGVAAGKSEYGKYVHIVGNGTSDDNRSNAHTLDWDGNAWFAGTIEGTSLVANANDKTVKLYANEEGVLVVEDADGVLHSVVLDDALNDAITTALQTAKDSGDFKGDKGDKGDPGEKGATGATGATGAKGADGKTPVKGTDYWTEEDKQEIIDAVLAAIAEQNATE